MPTQGELVVAARAGDRQAFASLVAIESPSALRLAAGIAPSPLDAEDAVQEAFVRAWRDLPGLRAADRWPAWFRRIVVRASLDQARRLRRLREVDLDGAPALGSVDPTAGSADRADLRHAMARLHADDRAILALRYGADLEVPDVAAALGIPLGTAKSRLSRATARLRAELGERA